MNNSNNTTHHHHHWSNQIEPITMSCCKSPCDYAIVQLLSEAGFDADKCFSSAKQDAPSQTDTGFGFVLALSANGCVLAVGAPQYDVLDADGNEVMDAGAVFVFERKKDFTACDKGLQSFLFRQQLTAEKPVTGSSFSFGRSLAISGDGNRICVGSPVSFGMKRVVYVFDRTAADNRGCYKWCLHQRVPAQRFQTDPKDPCKKKAVNEPDGPGPLIFGTSLALSRDGRVLLVGARDDISVGVANGSVYFYEQPCASKQFAFRQRVEMTPSVLNFGGSVALTQHGNTAVIGASTATVSMMFSAGEAFVFKRCKKTLKWTLCQSIQSPEVETGEFFGHNVDVTPDGRYLIVWAPLEDKLEEGGSPSDIVNGVVTVYEEKDCEYVLVDTLCPKPTENLDFAGIPVGDATAISDDGCTIAVGYYVANRTVPSVVENGAVVVFQRKRGTNQWRQKQVITIDDLVLKDGGPFVDSVFGIGLVMSGDGCTLVAGGGPGERSTALQDMAFVMERQSTQPQQKQQQQKKKKKKK